MAVYGNYDRVCHKGPEGIAGGEGWIVSVRETPGGETLYEVKMGNDLILTFGENELLSKNGKNPPN